MAGYPCKPGVYKLPGFFVYISLMNRFRNFVEWNAFGVCSAIGARMGIATSKIRQYFMYTSILTMGSPIIIYMVLAFWRNMRKYMKAAKRNPWYYL
jgi:phage shock protein PspC (stress-responsive transcriptional regulator)